MSVNNITTGLLGISVVDVAKSVSEVGAGHTHGLASKIMKRTQASNSFKHRQHETPVHKAARKKANQPSTCYSRTSSNPNVIPNESRTSTTSSVEDNEMGNSLSSNPDLNDNYSSNKPNPSYEGVKFNDVVVNNNPKRVSYQRPFSTHSTRMENTMKGPIYNYKAKETYFDTEFYVYGHKYQSESCSIFELTKIFL